MHAAPVKEFATVVATHDFDPATLGLNRAKSRTLLVYKGDTFAVFSTVDREWWAGRCLTNDNIGYIPSAYVRPQTEMDAATMAAIAREVKITSKAKQTKSDAPSQELNNILKTRQEGGGPIKPKKQAAADEGVSSELQKLLARRNKIIEEDEEEKVRVAAQPEFRKISLKKTSGENTDPDENLSDGL